MKIGIYFTPNKEQGGVYQYCLALLESFENIPNNKYVIISTSKDIPEKYSHLKNFQVIDMHTRAHEMSIKTRDFISNTLAALAPKFINTLYKLNLFGLLTYVYRFTDASQIRVIEEQNFDLVFYPTSSNLSFLASPPAVVAIHDFAHRVYPTRFKEVSAGGRWESREYGFTNIARSAFRVLVDSNIGREDMINYYHTSPNKVVALPFLPPSYLNPKITHIERSRTKKTLRLPEHYLFYPAKFWPHKNHLNLVKAVHILKKKGIKVNLLFAGAKDADFSSYDEVVKSIKSYHLEKQIRYLGYISPIDNQISAIYKLADAMIMPTYFGPTNIPVLEAWTMGTPVIYSNIRGCRQQLGDAGLLINPDDPMDIAKKIQEIYKDNKLKKILVERGYKRLSRWTTSDFNKKIKRIIYDLRDR